MTSDFMAGPGGSTPPEIEEATVFAFIIAGVHPVLILLPRFRGVFVWEDGGLFSADGWTWAVRAHGARPLEDLEFAADPAAGWRVILNAAASSARIAAPPALVEDALYEGSLECDAAWWRQVERQHREGRGLVVVTGTARPDADAALEMMEAGRASWVRAHVEIA